MTLTRALLVRGRHLANYRRRLVSDLRCAPCGCGGPCRRFWRAALCNPERCVQAVEPDVYVCVDARCHDGSRIKHGTVLGGNPYCYRVDTSRMYCIDTSGPAHDPACAPLPPGAQIITGQVGCSPPGWCANCPPLSAWYLTDICPCNPPGHPMPQVVWDCRYVETMLAAGRCPVHGIPVPNAGIMCVRPSSTLVYELPPGHNVLGGPEPPYESCCECCPSCPGVGSLVASASCPGQWPPQYSTATCCCGPDWDISGRIDVWWSARIAGQWCLQRWDTYIAVRRGTAWNTPIWTVTERWRGICEEPMSSHTYTVAAPDNCRARAWHDDIVGRWGLGGVCEPQYGHSGQWQYDCTRASGRWVLDQRPDALLEIEWSVTINPDTGGSGCITCGEQRGASWHGVMSPSGCSGCGNGDDASARTSLTLDDLRAIDSGVMT